MLSMHAVETAILCLGLLKRDDTGVDVAWKLWRAWLEYAYAVLRLLLMPESIYVRLLALRKSRCGDFSHCLFTRCLSAY